LGDVGDIGKEAFSELGSGIGGGRVSHGDRKLSRRDLGLMFGWKPALPVMAKFS
jgi:hypothetical protein